jgi:hypothetical protein
MMAVAIGFHMVAATGGQAAPAGGDQFVLGICCHPKYTRLMPIDWDGMFRWVKGCGATLCRIDWAADWETNDAIASAAAAADVELLPVLFPPAPAEDTEQAWYAAARAYGEECGRRYGEQVRHFELNNERDLRCMTKFPNGGDRDGALASDYDPEKYAPVRGMLRGLAEGLRASQPQCLRMIDTGGWLHFGFIDLLVRDNVPFDILAWHWYSEMRDMTQPIESYSGSYVVLDRLATYGRPVWITEGNVRNGTLANTEGEQAQYLVETIRRLRDTGKVGCYVTYELFDEPEIIWAGGEAYYGIVHCEWALNEGREFPGAEGSVAVAEVAGRKALVLAWDLTGGGRYVTANWLPPQPAAGEELRLSIRGEAGDFPLLLRFVDSTGQHLQLAPRVTLTGEWQTVTLDVSGPWAAHWAGANDGVVHQPLRCVWIGTENPPTDRGRLAIAKAELLEGEAVSYCFDFETDEVFQAKKAWHELRRL